MFTHLLSVITGVYAAVVVVCGLARILSASVAFGLITLLDNFLAPVLLVAPALLLVVLVLRRWKLALVLAPMVIVLALVYGRQVFAAAAADDPPDFTLMTFNVYAGANDTAASAAAILAADADIVVLQEVDRYFQRTIGEYLDDAYPYQALHATRPARTGLAPRLGLAVFSRYPLLADSFSTFGEQSSQLRLQFVIDGTTVTLYTVHLANPLSMKDSYDPERHAAAISNLLDLLAGEPTPLIVAGDFNMTDLSDGYGRMAAQYTDSFRESGRGLGFTFPTWSPIPLMRLDYVFHTAGLRSLRAEVGGASGDSDHLPVIVDFALDPPAAP